jgi:hypothetical protein
LKPPIPGCLTDLLTGVLRLVAAHGGGQDFVIPVVDAMHTVP